MRSSIKLDDLKQRESIAIGPKVYINGFPKSGLHLAELMGRGVGGPVFVDQEDGTKKLHNWMGSFNDNAWTNNWVDISKLLQRIRDHPEGTLLKGHCGYLPEIEQTLYEGGQAVAFIYRDLRDVAVSQAFHITSDIESRVHPGKDLYKSLDSFEEVLLAVIEGIDIYPGLIERWELYAPWLDVDWVFATSFEVMRRDPWLVVDSFVRYVYHRTASHYGVSIDLNENHVKQRTKLILESMKRTDTPTYRKGNVGGWQWHFTDRVTDAFKDRAGDWLVKLGYEEDDNW